MTVTGISANVSDVIREVDIAPLYHQMLADAFVEPAKTSETTAPATNNLVTAPAAQIQHAGTVTTSKLELLMHGTILSTKPFVIGDAHGNTLQFPSQSEADGSLKHFARLQTQECRRQGKD